MPRFPVTPGQFEPPSSAPSCYNCRLSERRISIKSKGIELSLIDPNNHRPVDYAVNRRLFDAELVSDANTTPETEKLRPTYTVLCLRWADPLVFDFATGYAPVYI